ncbi:MAG: thioredoxin domain-containing protein [Cyanobacteriota bacterium]|nr:thioredoxin domain-containing protein [Cyanobacteriota bacterium]
MADLSRPSGSGVEQLSDASVAAGALGQGDLLLLDVWARWCGPCRLMAPMMDWAANTYGDQLRVAKLEADPNPLTVEKLGIQGLPTLILFRRGEEVSRHEGAIPLAQLKAFVEAHL